MIRFIFKKINILLIILISCFSLSSCQKEETTYLSDSVAIVYKDNVPYLLNLKGEMLSLGNYDAIVPYFDNIIIVKKDNLFGYIKNTGEPITEVKYSEAYPFSEGKAVVAEDNKFYIINEEGHTIYEFTDSISSNSSFSENYLVVTRNNKQGFLKYDEATSTFDLLITEPLNEETSLLDSNFVYDYCGKFEKGYAVVGNLNQNNELKYTHINSQGNRLYELEWDFANNFSEGYAVVGNMVDYTVRIYCSNRNDFDNRYTTNAVTMGYMYVTPEGQYIGTTTTNDEGNEVFEPYIYAAANDFRDGVALVADLYFYSDSYMDRGNYDFSTQRYFYNYDCIKDTGNSIFSENGISQNNWGGALCIYKEFFQLGDYYVANYFSASWQILSTDIEVSNPSYPFSPVQFDLKNYKTDEELNQNFPWIQEYLNSFTYGSQSASYVVDHVTIPYNITSFETSKFLDNQLVAKTQVYSGIDDTCGIISINLVNNKLELSYIIPPLYDEIIY